MDNTDPKKEEEYVWTMKSRVQSEDTMWKERSSSKGGSEATFVSEKKQPKQKRSQVQVVDDHTSKVLASLVPDEIIYNVHDYSIRSYESCLLFGDVSGFTDLCEKYNKTGKGGPSRLTQVLNSYIGSMVLEIMSHGGDVLKFSGDAFLAMWKSGVNVSMQDVVHDALDCALMIQKSYGTYETDVGVFLRVKLAISAGSVKFSLIGEKNISHYVVVGKPIWDVKAAEHVSSAGEIMVSMTAWKYINPVEYKHEKMPGGQHIKVLGCGANWRNTQRTMRAEPGNVEEDASKSDGDSEESDEERRQKMKTEEFTIRPAVNAAARLNLKEALRRFIIPPVMRGIDLDEPLEYMTEMRKIVILFINVVTEKMEINSFIRLVDDSYKAVCRVVDAMEGCVNKVSLFDKDLMFVVIFGLRGFKHEMESQIGLRCATECYHAINALQNVKTCSVAVTTGNTYCGVVGHTLRREYTVISLTVNKAARLMVAYPNKVTCDRETFLHSKMQAKNFILQEYKYLKGIVNPGPCYEFKEEAVSAIQGRPLVVNPCPLLGRDYEVKRYLHLLQEFLEMRRYKKRISLSSEGEKRAKHSNTLYIQAEPRQGKTRLLEELIYDTPDGIPINRITLTVKDKKIPFQTVQLIFSLPLGLNEVTTSQDREEKISIRLHKVKVPDLLCGLNQVFSVDFKRTDVYKNLNEQQKKLVLRKLIKQLCFGCFIRAWVVMIDDAHYIDTESWPLIQEIIDIDIIFLVLTVQLGKPLCKEAEICMKHRNVTTIELSNIDKWYHAGLACQILGVRGIPADLEKVIQMRSTGNPGWVESYLVSLIQAGGLLIRDVSEPDLHEYGLVLPPESMLVRKGMVVPPPDENPMDTWEMYHTSYKESHTDLSKTARLKVRRIRVCTINHDFNIDDVDPELTLDVIMLKTFDSLTSYEQMLLKCSATIGETIPRDMLLYVMSATSPRATAIAVAKLFEIRVLQCAKGDFTQGDTSMIFTQRLLNPNHDLAVRCDCRGLTVLEGCNDLPKYASCGLMRFRLPMFRETTYNLLTDKQKKEFHHKAVRYLEKETRRCRSCGFGFFVRILGTRNTDDLRRKTKRSSKYGSEIEQASADVMSIRKSSMRVSMVSGDHRTSEAGSGTLGSMRSSKMDMVPSGLFAVQTIFRMRKNVSLTRTFSAADFSSCQCPLILNTMYSQMLEHCKGAGLLDKMMDVLLEYAYVCIVSCNVPQAMKILDEASACVESLPHTYDDSELVWRIPLQRGKISTLVGHSQLQLGQIDEAFRCFYEAMKYYKFPFPTSKRAIKFKTFCKELKQNFGLFIFPSVLERRQEGYQAEFCDNLAECLSLMCDLFIEVNMWTDAELAAVWALNKSLQSEMDFQGMCNAFANMIQVMHYLGKQNVCIALEVHALRLCYRKKSSVEEQELKAVAKLYGAIFACRLLRSEIERALHIGYIMLRMCANVHAVQLSLRVFPLLYQALLMTKRVTDAASILQEIEYYAEEDTDNSGKMWFYALCVELQLETGYCLLPFKHCERFYQIEGETSIAVRDPDSERRYFTVMWLWCIRNEEWEAAGIWFTKAGAFPSITAEDSLSNIFTALYFLEGLILELVCKMDRKNVKAVAHAYSEISILIKNLEKIASMVKIILPRLYHLKAYFKFVRYNDTKAFNLLHKGKKCAEKYENLLEVSWINHSEQAWTNSLSALVVDFWRDHCDPGNLIDYHEIDMNGGKLGFFTLPIPLYC